MDNNLLFEMINEIVAPNWVAILALITSFINIFFIFRLKEKEHIYDKKIQYYRSELSKKEYVSQVRFDAEYRMYQELSSRVADEIINTILLNNEPDLTDEVKENIKKIGKDAQDHVYAYAPFIEKKHFDKFQNFHNDCAKLIHNHLYQKNNGNYHINTDTMLDDYLLFMNELRQYLQSLDVK